MNLRIVNGLPVWGNADQIYIDKVSKLQKKAIRSITFSDYQAPVQPLLKDLEILSVKDLFKQQVASLMWDLDHDLLPTSISNYFSKRRNEHSHQTRLAVSDKYTVNSYNTSSYGFKSFQVQGALLLNDLKNQDIYINARSKKSFLNQLRVKLLDSY